MPKKKENENRISINLSKLLKSLQDVSPRNKLNGHQTSLSEYSDDKPAEYPEKNLCFEN